MKILVTGGTGFIGRHLIDKLLGRYPGVKIDVVDDLSSSVLTQVRNEFFKKNGIAFYYSTVANFEVPKRRYDQIYHLACRVGPAHVLKYAGRMAREITDDAEKMANVALRDEAPLISVSTSEVYGKDPNGMPQSEDTPLCVPAEFTPRLEYTVGKLLTEIALINLARVTPLRVNFIRPYNIVGPYQSADGGFVLPRFVESALAGEEMTVFGDGRQVRAFTHVSDLVNALILVMESDVNRRCYNVGTPENTCTIIGLAENVKRLLRSSSDIVCVDPRKIFGDLYANAPSKIPDISLIQRELGWRPVWSLSEIISNYAEFLQATEKISAVA